MEEGGWDCFDRSWRGRHRTHRRDPAPQRNWIYRWRCCCRYDSLLINPDPYIVVVTLTPVLEGSLAAAIQSIFYGGATGGVFSLFQMLGATLALPAIEGVVFAAAAAGAGTRLL